MASAVDWTVDKLLSGVQTLNARAESAQNTIRANRTQYMNMLRSLPQIPDAGAREALRARLAEWIRGQVAVENRFAEFSRNFVAAKAAAKRFLEGAHITPPSYLGVVVAVPVAVAGGIAVGLAVIATIIILNNTQTKSLENIGQIAQLAREHNWSAQETAEAIRAAKEAAEAGAPDPLGLRKTTEALLPLVLIGVAIYLFGPMLQRKMSHA